MLAKKCICGGELIELKSAGDLYEPLAKKYVCNRCGKKIDENTIISILLKQADDNSLNNK